MNSIVHKEVTFS